MEEWWGGCIPARLLMVSERVGLDAEKMLRRCLYMSLCLEGEVVDACGKGSSLQRRARRVEIAFSAAVDELDEEAWGGIVMLGEGWMVVLKGGKG